MTGLGTLVAALCAAVTTLWVNIRKQRIETMKAEDESKKNAIDVRKEELAVDAASTNDVLKHFRMILKQRTEFFENDRKEARLRHEEDMADVRKELESLKAEVKVLRQENVLCREESVRRDEHSKNQDERLKAQEMEISRLRHELLSTQSAVGNSRAILERIVPDNINLKITDVTPPKSV